MQVTAPAGCAYTAASPASGFVTITAGASGSGNGTVTYSVPANSGGSESTTLTIAGLPFTINQLNGCVFGLTPSSAAFSAAGGNSSFILGASNSNCPFTATSNSPSFLAINSSVFNSGTTLISYSVSANSGTAGRTGTLTVGGQTYTVVEAGQAPCTYSLAQAPQAFSPTGGTGTASVQSPHGCVWPSTTSGVSWVTINSVDGSSDGMVSYTVQANPGTAQRTGTLTIAGISYAVVQAGASPLNCTASAAATPQVAIEGRTEVLGDLILTCTGLVGTLTADISLTLNTNVTNTIAGGTTDAGLLVNGANPQPGLLLGNNTLDWPGVSLVAGSSGAATVRITNVRADASLLTAPASLQSVPITGVVNVNATAAVAVPLTNPTQILAYAAPTVLLQQGTSTTGGSLTSVSVQFQEASIAAFHASFGTTPATRLRLVLTNLPSTAQVFAPIFPMEGTTQAQLYSTDANGLGGSPVPVTSGSYQQVPVNAQGVAAATWIVLSADPTQFETETFPLLLQYVTAQNLSQIQMAATLAPVSQVSVDSVVSPAPNVPRYRDFSLPQPLVNLRATTTVQATSASTLSTTGQATATFTTLVVNDVQDTPATDTTIQVKITGGGSMYGCQSNAGTCTMSGNQATVTVGTLPPGHSVAVNVYVTANTCLADRCEVVHEVSTVSDQPNADLSAGSANSIFLVNGSPLGTPFSITASGTPQSTPVGTPFANPLQVTVTDAGGNPVNNATVSYTAPLSGASAVLSSGTAMTNASGVASVTATANNTAGGPYAVTATVMGLAGPLPAVFTLTNTLPPIPPNGDVAQGRPATQSSTLPGTPPASVAVDGNTDGAFFDGSVTATNLEPNPWWQVDLGASTSIGSIAIWNRTDCCGSRLSDYWVFVSNTPFLPTDTPTTLQSRAGTFSIHQTTAPNPSATIAAITQGQYVRVQLSSPGYLSLAEVQVFTATNLALNKPASQSSAFPGSPSAGAAVDGNTDGAYADGSVTTTNLDTNAWWQVDLGATATVSSIVIWNRTDCCGSRLNDYWVFVSNTPFLATDTPSTLALRAATFSSHQTTAPSPSTNITVGAQGRYVRVQLTNPNYLSLAEVQVIGTGGTPAPVDLAQFQPATQSSTLPGTPAAGVAVDGNTDGVFADGSVTATNLDTNAWWQVDLGASALVNSIVVWNRMDCCGSRLSDYWVFVSNTPFLATDTPATLQARSETFSSHQTAAPSPSAIITNFSPPPCTTPVCPLVVQATQGRYVRVQLTNPNYLSLAEVQVYGSVATPTPVVVATESSTLPGTPAAAVAIDGNTDGNYNDGSVTATNLDTNAWWQVDLGASTTVNTVTVWNRTDCCGSRLSDYWVFVSNTPFLATDTPATLQNRAGTTNSHQTTAPNPSVSIPFGGVQGRYVRVQLTGANYLSLAEVQVQ